MNTQKTACILCSRACGISVTVENGQFTRIRGDDDHPVSKGYICQKAARLDHYLLGTGTGTGLAPFMSIIKDSVVYERFEKVILVHGVRQVSEFAYQDYIMGDLLNHEYLGEAIRHQLIYYPTATREPFRNNGRRTDLIKNGKLAADIGLPALNPEHDREMLCGSPSMLKDCCRILDDKGFVSSMSGAYLQVTAPESETA